MSGYKDNAASCNTCRFTNNIDSGTEPKEKYMSKNLSIVNNVFLIVLLFGAYSFRVVTVFVCHSLIYEVFVRKLFRKKSTNQLLYLTPVNFVEYQHILGQLSYVLICNTR